MNKINLTTQTAEPENSETTVKRELAESTSRVLRLNDTMERQGRIFNAIFSTISDFAYAFDRDGRFLFINKALLDLWGMDLEKAVGKNFHELPYPPDLAAKLQDQIQTVFATGNKVTDETPYINPAGIFGYYEYIFCPVFAPDGTVEIVAGSTRDITKRKLTEQQLRESEEQYRSLFESIDEGFCIIEVLLDEHGKADDYRFLELNPSFERQTGLKNAQGKRIKSLAPDHEHFWFDVYGEIASSGRPARFEHEAKALGRFYDVYAFRVGEPGDNKVAVLFNDISERKRAEEEILQLNERNRDILESITDAFFAVDRDWRFTYVNAQAERVLERAPGELLGKIIWDEYPGLNGTEFEKAYRTAADERVPSRTTAYYADHERWYEVNAFPAADGITVYFRNVTEQIQAEESLRESDRRKDEFIAMLAHELRNPLAPIRSGLEVLRNVSHDKEAATRTLDTLERQTNHVVRLVDDLLDISRITRGKVRLQKERFEIKKAIEMAVETSREAIDASGNKLTVSVPDTPLLVDADLMRTAQIFLNILNNAAKFGPAGGSIDVRVEENCGEVVVTIKDTGPGIPPESHSTIFELFGQIDRDGKPDGSGLGVGLSVVKQLTEMHGGSVEVRSDGTGNGSEFIVRMPLASGPPPTGAAITAEISPAESTENRQRRILVVDDNEDAAEMLEALLSLNGHIVRTSFSARKALDIAAEFAPDVCLLDIGMPEMDGYELAVKLREFLPDALIISVSGWGQEKDRQRSREAGFDHHFVKPVEFNTLLKVIDNHGGKNGDSES